MSFDYQMNSVSEDYFWESRYLGGNMPWDIGEAAPAFVKYFCSGKLQLATTTILKIAILGCGRGHDAFFLTSIKEGEANEPCFQVYGFDFSRSAIDFCICKQKKENLKNADFYRTDFFQLQNEKRWKGFFDFVIEHTTLCAIDPKRRKEYSNLISYLLKPKGKLVGLFFIRPIEKGGPPFGMNKNEVEELFSKEFTVLEKPYIEQCLHKGNLEGEEYFGVFEKKVVK